MKRIGDFLETVVVVVIIVALGHTFLEDFSVLAGWTVAVRRWIIWAGLGIDLFFTVEFFCRLYFALAEGKGGEYIFRQRGWIDFFASIPLLLFNSLPNTLALLAGAGLVTGLGSFLNVLKVIKAVRIARILRLMRIVKLFRRIRYAHSPMAQRHLAIITTISVTVLVTWVLLANLLGSLGVLPGLDTAFQEAQGARAKYLAQAGANPAVLTARAGRLPLWIPRCSPSGQWVRPPSGRAITTTTTHRTSLRAITSTSTWAVWSHSSTGDPYRRQERAKG